MRINHNIAALNTYRFLNTNTIASNKSLEKLSSGLRITKAGDDAAGLAISEKMRNQIHGLDQASRNAQDNISLIQTAEGGLNEVHSILLRMRELAVQSSNATNTDDDRKALQDEIAQLKDEIDRIGNTTEFNTKKLLNGSLKSDSVSIGTNQTIGAQVLEQTFATVAATATFSSGNFSTIDLTSSPKQTITIDKNTIEIDWAGKLTDYEKTLLDADYSASSMTDTQKADVKNALERVINESIDEYNARNGASVEHITIYENSSGKLVMKSGKAGQDSQIQIATAAATTVLGAYFGSGGFSGAGDDLMIKAVAADTLAFDINGIRLRSSALTATAAGADADTVASDIQAKLRTALQNYNTGAGLVKGMDGYLDYENVYVVAEDGRFKVTSASGAITFIEQEGYTTVADLGLSQAQTEASGSGGLTFQIGANRGQTMVLGINDMRSAALGVANINIGTQSGASLAITAIDKAVQNVSLERSKLGAVQNRLEHTINNLNTSSENLTAAESRIRDVDMAKEMMEFTKSNILAQAAQAMLAQANSQPQGVLQLLR